MPKLLEGLERHALEHLVAPLISIDEYESKIDDKRVIVIGFFVKDLSPAQDLSNFIEKSSIRPLDTDVSPAPNDQGFYMVFVEMSRDPEFPKRVITLLDQVSNLTNTKKWQFIPYETGDDTYDVSEKNIRSHVNLDPEKVEIYQPSDEYQDMKDLESPAATPATSAPAAATRTSVTEQIGTFFKPSLADNVELKGQWLRITTPHQQRVYKIVDWRDKPTALPVMGLVLGDAVLRESNELQRMLGHRFTVDPGDQLLLVSDGTNTLILDVDTDL